MMNLFFNSNEAPTWMWETVDKPDVLSKTKGSGIITTNFIEEHNRYLHLSLEEMERARRSEPDLPEETREFFEYGAAGEGYWTMRNSWTK